ncbi:hypothetical protein Dvina_39545 [Dactylosporangium vinaceum]|uniref:hypothetical protein n=1 Tax=Dactylosporangium vinaceum TaxID=53362 RepID=UPI001CA99F84|nr:hypothetical protein [Dactylosporangium vinaceum]UAB94211.1 hypothetical protein Dvina_39545 [Dactylosporangium vinaceum]
MVTVVPGAAAVLAVVLAVKAFGGAGTALAGTGFDAAAALAATGFDTVGLAAAGLLDAPAAGAVAGREALAAAAAGPLLASTVVFASAR